MQAFTFEKLKMFLKRVFVKPKKEKENIASGFTTIPTHIVYKYKNKSDD